MSETPEQKPLKSTLNLPQTAFPMKAGLPQNEPTRLAKWTEEDLYGQIRAARAGAPKYILHDGPPYANGAIHLGHALNKCIKDFVVKTKTMAGFDAPYVPGWDCHGLPIEIKVDEQLGRKKLEMDAVTVRQHCRDYAQKYVDLQRSQFLRMGVLGRWNDPYLTMSFPYEARIVETFYEFFERDYVYKGLKPVYWCWHDRTALAEAEVEYEQHTSPSIYVRYKLTSDPADLAPELAGREVYTIIYTTTPWTLPSSQAVAFHPELEYVALENADGLVYVVAEALSSSVKEVCGFSNAEVLTRFSGRKLDRTTFRHPLNGASKTHQHPILDEPLIGTLADYVTTEQGTGAVHTSPAHGPDDFATGKTYNISPQLYVDDGGLFKNSPIPEINGLHIYKANPILLEMAKENGSLLASSQISHSYPHCWRCHKPVIYRATWQWFIDMETPIKDEEGNETTFRACALNEISKVTWDPSWGEERISNMIATRPDWCISRQRIWGVPIALFTCTNCEEQVKDPALNRRVVEKFQDKGADYWYWRKDAGLGQNEEPYDLVQGRACVHCGNEHFKLEMDILDVWFESGSSWHAVLEQEPELQFPADLYTEGGDQHRGWFHSSLLNSVAIRNQAPYKYVATSGWTLDEQRRAFSKSLGNGVDPVAVMDQLGGDIVRLWVASVDFREDVIASVPLMKRLAEEIYRKLRNTFRILLANLYDFDPAKNAINDFSRLEPLDQYMLAKASDVVRKVRASYDAFEFHRAYHAINEFCNADLSAFYIDALKDRLYTFAPNAHGRRSAQTAIWKITEALVRLVAPVLSFTADEMWEHMPKVAGREASVHIAHFPKPEDLAEPEVAAEIVREFEQLIALRPVALRGLEEMRQKGEIGKSLEAIAVLLNYDGISKDLLAAIEKYVDALPELFNVSAVRITVPTDKSLKDVGPWVSKATGKRCERCWRYTYDVGDDDRWPVVCSRCAEALREIDFPPMAETVSA